MKEFCKALLPLRRRLTLEAFLRYFLWCMIMASGLALAVFLLSAFVVLPERFLAAGALCRISGGFVCGSVLETPGLESGSGSCGQARRQGAHDNDAGTSRAGQPK